MAERLSGLCCKSKVLSTYDDDEFPVVFTPKHPTAERLTSVETVVDHDIDTTYYYNGVASVVPLSEHRHHTFTGASYVR